MSSSIKTNQLKRAISQHTAQRKSDLTSRHINELKTLKNTIKQSQADKRAMANAEHAINHINKKPRRAQADEDMSPRQDSQRLYTRQGKLEEIEVDRTEVEDAEARVAAHRDQQSYNIESAQRAKENDDFYKPQNRGNMITEDGTGYYIDAYAPDHERDSIKVSVTHNKAVVSGSRKSNNEEETNQSKITTNNFQSFREEFDFGTPVVSEGMTRERNGDYIRFFIPKLGAVNPNTEDEA